MRIVVCVKPIKTVLVYHNESEGDPFVMNPYDLFALELVLALKKLCGCEVVCLSMGASAAKCVLAKALAMGADSAILLNDAAFTGSDTISATYALSKAIETIGGVDIIVCGKESADRGTGQTAYGLSKRLGLQCIPGAAQFTIIDGNYVIAEYKAGNTTNTLRIRTPFVASCSDFQLSRPIISLKSLKAAKNKEIVIWKPQNIGAEISKCGFVGAKTKVLSSESSLNRKDSMCIEGTATEKAAVILDILMIRRRIV